jgi:non-specific serine/threonine protein kinase
MNSGSNLPERITFGRFCVMPHRRELLVEGEPVKLGTRAFDVLVALIEGRGAVVSKDALMARVWPDQVVEENNLEVQIATLRAHFGSKRALIRTIYRRGYQFTGEIQFSPANADLEVGIGKPSEEPEAIALATNLPQPITELIGRHNDLNETLRLLDVRRLLTLTGTGGIGKTRLALAAGHRLLSHFRDGVWLVELGPLSDPDLVPVTVAAAVGLRLAVGAVTAERVASALKGKELLLVLDNCEHLIGAAATMVEALLRANPAVRVMATSREPLRTEGEYVYAVPPLAVPAVGHDHKSDPLEYGAVQLFVERVRATELQFVLDGQTRAKLEIICRRLDGIPLAIELAAARVAALGIEELSARLESHLQLLTIGRRTAPPRHRTLRAALDWSYELLSGAEQQLLSNLAVFPSTFTLDASIAVMGDVAGGPSAVMDGLASLVAKSLITPDRSDPRGRWRLLETTRVYALEKLVQRGGAAEVARRHAEFYLALFAPFSPADRLQTDSDKLSSHQRDNDNIRAALSWAFAPEGDTMLGVALAAAATDFWVVVSQVEEASDWARKALALIGDAAGSRHELILQYNLGMALMYMRGMLTSSHAALTRALMLARELGDFDYQRRAILVLWLFSSRAASSNDALALAHQYEELARNCDDQSRATSDLMVAMSQTFLAAHGDASARLQRMIDRYWREGRHGDLKRLNTQVHITLAVNLLARGFLDAASRETMSAIEEARSTGEAVNLGIVLTWSAGLILLSLGNVDTAGHFGEELIDHALKHALFPFHAAGLCVRGSVVAKRGDPEGGLEPLRRGLVEMQEAGYLMFYPFFRAEFAAALGALGRFDESLAEIDGALHFADENNSRWFVPDILRTKGELVALRGSDDPEMVTNLFLRSMNQAHDQQALFWELRTATSLARHLRNHRRPGDALAHLQTVYDRFTEGLDMADLKSARALLDSLRKVE